MSESLPAQPERPNAQTLVGVIVYAYGRGGLGAGRWHDIATVLPDPQAGTYRILVAEIPDEINRLWRVTGVSLADARSLLELRTRSFVETDEFKADSVRLNNLDDDGLTAARRFDRTMDAAFDWALTVEGNSCLDPNWSSPRADDWRRATLSGSAGDRAGRAARVAVDQMIYTAQRLAAAPPT